jgi:diguanylate cyclase (GGDEF)-like protein/PAS domain S-box-containing protein
MKLPCFTDKWQCPLLDRISGGVLVYNLDRKLVYHNAAGLRILGLESDSEQLREFSKGRYFDEGGACVDPEDHPLSRCIHEGRAIEDKVLGFMRDGRRRWILVSSSPIENGAAMSLVLVSFIDYTAFKEVEDRLDSCPKDTQSGADVEERLLLATKVFATIAEGVVVTAADGTILSVNKSFTSITGYSPDEALGENPRILKSRYHDEAFYRGMWESLVERGRWQGEIINRRKDGTAYPEWLSIAAVRDRAGNTSRYVAVFHDRSEIKARDDEIDRLLYRDVLTDLPNRFLFLDRIGGAIRMAEREDGNLAVLLFDIHKLKYINSRYGYLAGDAVIKEMGNRIRTALRRADTVARIGGDEFAVLLPNVEKPESAMQAASSVMEALRRPFSIAGNSVSISVVGGIALWPSDGSSPDELVANAAVASKSSGEGFPSDLRLYDPELGRSIGRRLDLESRLRKAVERGELELHYQPKVLASDRRIAGMEALVRWRDETGSLIPPSSFIPLAEESGLILPIGEWVLFEALRRASAWRAGGHDLVVSVNLSGRQFRDREVERLVARALEALAYPPSALDLEITESVAMSDIALTSDIMNSIAESGVRFSLDDFGTGYSSLSYIKRLPISCLKIDQSFVREIGPEAKTETAIVRAVLSMAHNLDFETVAEGCETALQFRLLKELGCTQIQGYYFSRPLPADEFGSLLDRGFGTEPGE